MKSILITAVTLFVLTTHMSSPALARDFHEGKSDIQQFIGLWEGIDPDDGGHQTMSLTDNGDGKVKLLLHDTFFSLCEGGRGIAQGTGEIESRHSLKFDDFVVKCFEDSSTTEVLKTLITLILNRDGTLFRGATGPLSAITYHRTSN